MEAFENEYTYGRAARDGDAEGFHASFDAGVEEARAMLGGRHPLLIGGREVESPDTFEARSPADTRVLVGTFQSATAGQALEAVAAARGALAEWGGTPYAERAAAFRACADGFSSRKFALAALLCFENGKSRLEAMGDVDEAIDFMRFYAYQLEKNRGFERETPHPDPSESTRTVMKPYGVWGVIAPFNFPSAIAVGMSTGALITGNTAVLKPASTAPLSSLEFARAIAPRMPAGAINFVSGAGGTVGAALVGSPDVDGIAFTGSREVGMAGHRRFTESSPRPFISEMGGKNPVIVAESADLDAAAAGVASAAFGYGGQKCSACSRVYVHESVADEFVSRLAGRARAVRIGMPWERGTALGPVIDAGARAKYGEAMALARRDGRVVAGGGEPGGESLGHGHFVEPAVVEGLPAGHRLETEELFLPIVCVRRCGSFGEAVALANDTEYGLTAGVFSSDPAQVDEFFSRIEAGVAYANRAASATTAALVSSQPFVGWKASGSTGRGAGGENYLQQFMRTQTQTRCR